MATLIQSARMPGPSWDETIVPALRKRLESESRTLAKRMSAVSISSLDEGPAAASTMDTATRDARTAYVPPQRYDSRPSTTTASSSRPRAQVGTSSGRSEQSSNAASSSSSASRPSIPRSRTYSQPYGSDSMKKPQVNGKASTTKVNGTKLHNTTAFPDSNRSVSPALSSKATDLKPTRIPKPRARTTSASSTQQAHQQQRSVNGYNHAPSSDLYPVQEIRPPPTARSDTSSFAVPSRQGSGILNESPPFKTNSNASSTYHPVYGHISRDTVDRDPSPARLSSESEEHPFEHWYRGEVSRNGGVGELRVAKRMEMLEIANYGHAIKSKINPIAALRGTANGINAPSGGNERRRRKRADSVSGILGDGRESLYLDDERAREVAMVLDEHPPTDLDDDDDGAYNEDGSMTETEENTTHSHQHHIVGDSPVLSEPTPTTNQPDYRSATPTNYSRPTSRAQNHPSSRIPTPSGARKSSDSHHPNPPPLQRGASEPPPSPPGAGSVYSQSQHRSTASTPGASTKARGKSPGSSGKKRPGASAKTRAKVLAARQKAEEESNRKSVAQYPTPDGDAGTLADAIPTWTQPKPMTGNWDEVVLPVVARKKGLDDLIEQADGSPRTRQQDNVVAPAPGTFGYDHSKYRPPRGDEFIPMDEFGRPPERIIEDHEQEKKENDAVDGGIAHDEPIRIVPIRRNPASPPPFAHYLPPNDPSEVRRTTLDIQAAPPLPPIQAQLEEEEEKGAGCCKCVIM